METTTGDQLTSTCKQAWTTFGKEVQMRQLQEECAELIVAINHHLRGRDKYIEKITEEIADLLIVLTQIIGGLDMYEQLDEQMTRKLQKLEIIINQQSNPWQSTK